MKWKDLLHNTFHFFALANAYSTSLYASAETSLRELQLTSASAPSAATDWWSTDSIKTLRVDRGWVKSAKFSPDGKWVASAGDPNGAIHIWDAASGGAAISTIEAHTNKIGSIDFSIDGTKLVSGSYDSKVKIWNVGSGGALTLRNTFDHGDEVQAVKFSPDGKYVASGGWDSMIKIWNPSGGVQTENCVASGDYYDEDGGLCYTLHGHTNYTLSLAFTPDSKTLASGSDDKMVRLWDMENGTELGLFAGHTSPVNSVDFTQDGTQLASGSVYKTINIWDFHNNNLIRNQTITAHINSVNSVAFSPDGKYLASGSFDASVKLWKRTSNYDLVVTFNAHADPVYSVNFSPDSQKIASTTNDKTIRIWGKPCKPGQYGSHPDCTSCAPGTFTNKRGMDRCIPCAAGAFQEDEGAKECVKCAVGGFCPGDGTDGSGFTLCPVGTCNDIKGGTNEASCIKCSIALGTLHLIAAGSFVLCVLLYLYLRYTIKLLAAKKAEFVMKEAEAKRIAAEEQGLEFVLLTETVH